ncbi:hypothetical protein BBC0122_018090 [Bartonella choladocola]|uniref:Uncharacterized protein n=1 Tax=Bartonella choladocola TaxID=2750995 RepID=A0A1U9MIW9_9HYPH|nr:hypothetical protein BBC0122_018090 [Bartonella choladocola]
MSNTAYLEQTGIAKPELLVSSPLLMLFNFPVEKTTLYGGAISTG